MKKQLFVVVMTTALSLNSSCGSDSDDSAGAAAGAGGAGTNENSALAKVTEGSASELMALGLQAIQSGRLAVEASSLRLQDGDGGGSGEASVQSENDPLCSNKAEPWDTVNNQRWNSGDGYLERLFYCAVNAKTYESVDSLIGQLTQTKSIFCSLEAAVGIEADKFTENGNNLVTADPINIELNSECWPQGAPDGLTSIPMESITLTKLAESTGFQYAIEMSNEEYDLDYEIRFFNKDGVFGFSTPGGGNTPGVGERFDLTIDTNNGVILLNVINDRNKDDDPYLSLLRMRVSGEFDAENGSFDSVSAAKGIYVFSGPGYNAVAGNNFPYSAYEVSGNSTTGFRYRHIWNQPDQDASGPAINTDATECSGGTATCEDAVDIGSTADVHTLVTASEAIKAAWSEHINDGLPLCNASTGDAAITLDAAPASTGEFGVCQD
ncbi:MAG: hypothetical protein ACOH5I_25175 [Oligoflexus sp.]